MSSDSQKCPGVFVYVLGRTRLCDNIETSVKSEAGLINVANTLTLTVAAGHRGLLNGFPDRIMHAHLLRKSVGGKRD